MYTPVAGSIHSDVPVKPVCPNEPSGRSSPRFDEYDESRSHPRPRTFVSEGGVAGDVMRPTVSGDRMRASCPERSRKAPPPSNMRQKIDKSSAVLKRPA